MNHPDILYHICLKLHPDAIHVLAQTNKIIYQWLPNTPLFWKSKIEYTFHLYTTQLYNFKQCFYDISKLYTIEGYNTHKYDYVYHKEMCQLFKENNIHEPYLLHIRDLFIQSINFEEDEINIYFNAPIYLQLYPQAECCSRSWFEALDNHHCQGKQIVDIKDVGSIDIPDPPGSDSIINHHMIMTFKDGDTFEFVLRNESNGYYDGELEIYLK